jgi:hypothetical protein
MRQLSNKFLVVNLAFLRTFEVPTVVSGVNHQIKRLQYMGLIRLVFVRCDTKSSGIEEYYGLSKKGQKLLVLFPEVHSYGNDYLIEKDLEPKGGS